MLMKKESQRIVRIKGKVHAHERRSSGIKKSSAGSYPDGSDTPVYVLNGYTKYHAVR